MTKEEMSELKELLGPINKKLEDLDDIKQQLEELPSIKLQLKTLDTITQGLEEVSSEITEVKATLAENSKNTKDIIALLHQVLGLIVTREEYEKLDRRVRVLESI